MSKNKSKEQVNNSQANISKNGSQAQLNQSKSQSSINNQSVLNQSLKDELNKSKTNEQVQQENQEDKLNQSQQNKNYTISAKSWDLNPHEVKFLNELYGEIQEAYKQDIILSILAEGLQEENKFENEQIELAQKDINTVQNVIEMLKEESDKEDDIRFAIDNALLNLATTKRKTEDENDKLRDLVRQRNAQLRMLVIKVKDQDQQLKSKDEQIKRLEQQVQLQGQTLRQYSVNIRINQYRLVTAIRSNKVEDEYRIKVVQEQLRKPRENKLFDESKFVDVNARDDPFDFWQNNAIREYPGEPKKLNDVVQKKTLWVAQKEDEKLNKFEYSKMPKSNESNFWGK